MHLLPRIRPCRFCNHDSCLLKKTYRTTYQKKTKEFDQQERVYFVVCSICEARGPNIYQDTGLTEDEACQRAIELWNNALASN